MAVPKPCPFCGVVPEIFPKDPDKEGNAWGMVCCINESCVARPSVSDGIEIVDDRGSGAYKNAAIIRWNRRVE